MKDPGSLSKSTRIRLILAGFVISQLVGVFLYSFFFPAYWSYVILDENFAIIMLGHIVLITFLSAIGGYFWALAGIPMKVGHRLAFLNSVPVLALVIFHPYLGSFYFLFAFYLVVMLICSRLGNWFGVRVFYE